MKQKILDLINTKIKNLNELAIHEDKEGMENQAQESRRLALNFILLKKEIEALYRGFGKISFKTSYGKVTFDKRKEGIKNE